MIVADAFARYQRVIFARLAEGTRRALLGAWRQRVEPTFGAVELASIRPFDVERAFAEWSGARSTRVDALTLLSHICRTAVKDGELVANPCVGVEVERAREFDPGSRALNMAEVGALLAVLPAAGVYRRFVLAMLYTGCRLGEVAGLRVGDVNLPERLITVSRTASPGEHGRKHVGPTKGRRVRTVPLAPVLLPVVLGAMEGKGQHDWLFPGPRGGTITSKNLSRALDWPRIREQVKTFGDGERPLCFHDLRHTAAHVLFEAGLSAPDVQAILGHSSLAVTQLYADTRREAARRGVAALGAFWASTEQGQPGEVKR